MGLWTILAAVAATQPAAPAKAAFGAFTVTAVVEVGCTVKTVGRSVSVRCGGRAPHEVTPPPRPQPRGTPPAGPGRPERVTITF